MTEASEVYLDYVTEADVKFLKRVEKELKSRLGGKLAKLSVEVSRSTVWLEGEGEDAGDVSLSFTTNLITSPPSNVTVYGEAMHDMRGRLEFNKQYKTGTLTTPEVVKLVVSQFFGMT